LEARVPQLGYGLGGKDAVGTPAVRHDRCVLVEVSNMLRDLIERDVDRIGQVTGLVLQTRTNIHDHDISGTRPGQQLVEADGLRIIEVAEEGVGQVTDLGELRLGQCSQGLVANDRRMGQPPGRGRRGRLDVW